MGMSIGTTDLTNTAAPGHVVTNGATTQPVSPWNPTWAFDPQTGQPTAQGYGTQSGPGNITVGPGTGSNGGTTTPSGDTVTNGITYGADGKPDMNAMYLAAHPQATDPWNPGATFSTPQSWQNFTFSNPTEDWQKNFNSLSGVDKFRYGFDPQGGGQQAMIAGMTAAGYDPNTIRQIASMFGGGTGNYGANLGISGDPYQGNIRQIGNQLWGTGANGQRYLIKDFGNSGNMTNATPGSWFQNTGINSLSGGANNPWDGTNTFANKPAVTNSVPTGANPGGGAGIYGAPGGAPGFAPGTTTNPSATNTHTQPYNPAAPGGAPPPVVPGGARPVGTHPKSFYNPWSKSPF